MIDDDDDMPPPLEDMSEQIEKNKKMKAKAEGNNYNKTDDHTEEVRLAPKKEKTEPKPGVSVIKQMDDDEFDKKTKLDEPKKEVVAA